MIQHECYIVTAKGDWVRWAFKSYLEAVTWMESQGLASGVGQQALFIEGWDIERHTVH